MCLRKLPEIKAFTRPAGLSWDAPAEALERWAAPVAAAEDPATISIYEPIGADWFGEGFTAKRMAAALRAIGPNPVNVSINSPGGDVFEGLAIYNQLREHPAEVKVKVMGLAASAASFIAMAGDRIEMGLGSFMMIHNSWGVVIGNRHEMRAAAHLFDEFDASMRDIYVARTGLDGAEVSSLMDAETWLGARKAVDKGFADATFDDAEANSTGQARADVGARRRLDALLARQGVPRAERRRLMREISGTQDAAGPDAMPCAGVDTAALRRLIATLKN
ncbi:head maturation protease, ClpP-related [Xanthobacter flavus]|uniref:head maturation protease, ClpP-related n=1 Tax=Xanthobacter flavus TaxID=281 RepID=UPI003729A03A